MSVLEDMVTAARAVREKAYAPYSRFKVGACLRTDTGQLVVGANVENAAYPQGQCAEASAIGNMIANGSGDKVVEVVVMGGGDALCTPCGGLPPAPKRIRHRGDTGSCLRPRRCTRDLHPRRTPAGRLRSP